MKKLFLALFLLLHFSTSIDAIEVTRHEAGLAGGTGTGNVVGPASSTDNAIPKYDGVTGRFLQNSGVTISDTNVTTFPAGTAVAPSIVSDDANSGFYFGSKGFDWSVDGTKIFGVDGIGVMTGVALKTAITNTTLYIQDTNSTDANPSVKIGYGIFYSTTEAQNDILINPTYNQTSTAGGTDVLIKRTATALGSGLHYFLDMQVGTTSWYNFRTGTTATTGAFDFTVDDTAKVAVNFSPILGIMDAGDEISVLKLAPTSTVNHAGGTLKVLAFGDITGDADATESMIDLTATGYDYLMYGTNFNVTTTGVLTATTLTGSLDPDLIAGDTVDDDKIDDVLIHFTTFAGAPTANDDSGDGYTVGWAWRNTTDGCLWVATDVTPTAAVWTSQCRPPLLQNYILVGNASGIAEATNILPIVTFGNGATSSGYFYLLEDADNGTNKIKVEAPQSLAADLTLTLTGGYDTIYVDAAAMIPSTTSGALQGTKEYGTNDIDIDYFAFDAGATEERVQFKLKMPETWDLGTVKVKFDWTSDTGSTAGDTVEWGIKAGALSNDDAIDAALGTAQVITDTLLANNGTDLQTTGATPALTIGGTPALGDVIVFEVYRNTDGTDDMAEDAWLTGITIQYSLAGVPAAW